MGIVFKDNSYNKLLEELNHPQRQAVTYEGGPLLVLAGAGSGKTRVLTHRAAWLIATRKTKPEEVLLLTFTNKAANEMKERITTLSNQAPFFAGTFHSFCARILRLEGKYIGINPSFIIYDEEDQKDAIKQILKDFDLLKDSYSPANVASEISSVKNQMITPLGYSEIANGEWQETFFKIYSAYEKFLIEVGALDFDDLLLKAVKLFEESREVLDKWQNKLNHVLVDEWQDTNKIQYKLTKLLVGKQKNITAVGDAAQSIYSWRGADFRNITNLIHDFPNIKIINLEQNYRSTQNILSAANSVISKNTTHPVLNLWTQNDTGEKIRIFKAKTGLDEASFVSREIKHLKTTEGFDFKDFAVLYRTNAQSRVLEEAFLHFGIPYIIVGGIRFYERKEIKDILSFLRLLVNPSDVVSERRVKKLGKNRFERFKNFAEKIREDLKDYSTLELMDKIVQSTDYLGLYQKESEENIARLENIKELRSVATEFPNIENFLENVTLVEAEQNEKGFLKSATINKGNSVTLMTTHAAKGLEFPVVFIVGMEEGLFPHARALWETSELEEERRLAYVGMTRAKNLLYLTYASCRLYFGQKSSNPPSRFLIEIPESLIKPINHSIINKILEYNFNE